MARSRDHPAEQDLDVDVGRHARRERDRAQVLGLHDLDPPQPRHLEHAEEGEHPLRQRRHRLEERRQRILGSTEAKERAALQDARGGAVRKKLSELEAENAELKARLAEIVVTRRDPPDLDAWKEKVSVLEKQLADAIKTAQDAAGAKK